MPPYDEPNCSSHSEDLDREDVLRIFEQMGGNREALEQVLADTGKTARLNRERDALQAHCTTH